MQYYVYAVYSLSIDHIYIGQTKDLEKRINDHKHGYSPYTSRAKDWRVFYKEVFQTRGEALKREKQLKSYRGREFLRNKLVGKNE
jgi:putative endonuclease